MQVPRSKEMSISEVNCLICLRNHTPVPTLKLIKLESENTSEGDPIDGSCESVKSQPSLIFLLRKLLEIPPDVCSYLRQSFGDPCLWISCCDSCSPLVEEGRKMFKQLTLLQKQLENIKNELKTSIVSFQESSSTSGNGLKGAAATVRSYIKSANRHKVDIQDFDKILAVNLNDCCCISNKSASAISGDYFGTEAVEEIDVKLHSLSSEEDIIENEGSGGIYNKLGQNVNGEKNSARDNCETGYLQTNHSKTDKIFNKESIEKPYECKICGNRYSLSTSLRRHKLAHTGKKPHKCETCGRCFALIYYLKSHQRTHTEERPFSCNICGRKLKNNRILKFHLRTHTREKPFKCSICGKAFSRSTNRNRHVLLSHNGEMVFKCRICGEQFSSSDSLKAHEVIHKGPHACTICGKVFKKTSGLKIHQGSHTGEKPYECKQCGNRYSFYSSLRNHIIATHNEEKSHKCDSCGKCFGLSTTFKYHLKTHTGEKPFVCDTCGKGFAQSSALKAHLRTHTGEKPFKCEACGKCFERLTTLKKHIIRIHTDERSHPIQPHPIKRHLSGQPAEIQFVCSTCGYACSNSDSLRNHELIHSREKRGGEEMSFKCDVCGDTYNTFGLLVRHSLTHQNKKSLNSVSSSGDASHNQEQNVSIVKLEEEEQNEIYILP